MTSTSPISALRVANEAFLVASTIERCPKTMMMRELVMNALEAASQSTTGPKLVRIGSKTIDGAAKLAIWNTGPGMSAAELHSICDLASSLHKENGLDKNFGMGAKVASLPSNKLGLRYRSCLNGVVSEVMLIQRDGVYGRYRYTQDQLGAAGEVADVTAQCQAEGYDLSADWTEVALLGNRVGQNTLSDPYDSDPPMTRNWLADYLTRRFFRVPAGVRLETPEAFLGVAERFALFDRHESVTTQGGIKVHYGYVADPARAEAQIAADGLPGFVGQVGIVHRDEIYGLRHGHDWLLDAPVFGFPFAARHCTVFIELPEKYGVRAEAYRQFLRFVAGDQRQVFPNDFAAITRGAMPAWLKDIIASFGNANLDYVAEISDELEALLAQLGVPAQSRDAAKPRGADDAPPPADKADPDKDDSPKEEKPPAPPRFEKPPEIIMIREPEQIDERNLQGRVARYYPQTHQLFINLTYSAVTRLASQLENDFASAPDAELRAQTAEDLAGWMTTRQVARALAYSLAKKSAGWTPAEIDRAQSPEALSLIADDYSSLLGPVRRRMAEALGMELPSDAEALSATGPAIWALRSGAELADAEQAARRALATSAANAGPLLRRVSSIELQRGNLPAAIEWARQAVAVGEDDPDNHSHLANLLQQQGKFVEAEAEILFARQLSKDNPARLIISQGHLKRAQGEREAAIALAHEAVAAEPTRMFTHIHLGNLLMDFGRLDEAEAAFTAGREQCEDEIGHLLRQFSVLEQRRHNLSKALDYAHAAIEADPNAAAGFSHLANVQVQQRDFDAAEQAVHRALQLDGGNPARFLRQLSSIEQQRGNLAAALDWAQQALGCNDRDVQMILHVATILQQLGQLDEALALLDRCHELKPAYHVMAWLQRLRSIIAQQKGNVAEAIRWAREAVALAPADVWFKMHLAELLTKINELDEAETLVLEILAARPANPAGYMRHMSVIAARRKNLDAALDWAQKSAAANPADAWNHLHLAGLLLQARETDAAEAAAQAAMEVAPPLSQMLASAQRHMSTIENSRRNMVAAVNWARMAIDSYPKDSWNFNHLAGLYMQQGQFDEALAAATEAVRLATGESRDVMQRRLSEIQARCQLAEAL